MRRELAILVIIVVALGTVGVAGASTYVRWVPVSASNPGLHDSNWSSVLRIYNRALDQVASVDIAFFPTAEGNENPAEVTVEVEPHAALEIPDVVATLFGESRPGALRLRSQLPFEASSRTFNDGGGAGTYGQGVPAFDPDDCLSIHGQALLGAANSAGETGMRSNLGLLNPQPWSDEVMVSLVVLETGEGFGPVTVELGPYGWMQSDAFALFGLQDREVESAVVQAGSLGGGPFAYLSVVDNQTGDGTFVMPVDGTLETTIPRRYDVTMTVNSTEGVELYLIAYDSDQAAEAMVPDPASGWTVDLESTSPERLCYTVYGTAGAAGGEVEVEILYTPQGGEAGRRVQRADRSNAGNIRLDGCHTMD